MIEHLNLLFHILIHLDQYLGSIILANLLGAYTLIGLLIFMEPGFFMPFLPGDTVIFVAATFAASRELNYLLLWLTVFVSALLGDSLNYAIGHLFGNYLTNRRKARFIKEKQVQKTREFYALYGGKTILFCRYVPVIRSIAPFMGGVGELPFKKFLMYDLLGVLIWSGLYLNLGFFFGNIPWVHDHLAVVIPIVVAGTMLPTLIVAFFIRLHKKRVTHNKR
jgi:membrane-associated protein